MWVASTDWILWVEDFEMKIRGQKVDSGMFLGPYLSGEAKEPGSAKG